ncbi:TPA: DUF359 domain-containing protein, partial [archaeon]|nr:DUF359 domain-containing protein [Candidatus Naiadarchaeales archaeon SRR2090153.bin1042]
MISDLVVNEEIKKYVRKPLGKIIRESQLSANFKGNVICVGDKVTLTCAKLQLMPKVAIVDYKVMRKKISAKDKRQLKKYGTIKLRAKNKAGTISLEAWNKVREALEFTGAIVKVEIDGEEDLLTLAAILNGDVGDTVIYGQPGKGIVVVQITEKKKQEIADMLIQEKAREFLKKFKGTTVIVHDSDADGMSSAVMFTHYVGKRKNKVIQRTSDGATISPHLKEEITGLNANNLIILDLGGEARNTIKELSQRMNVLIIDHHKMFEDDFGKALYLNPQFFNVPDDYTSPTSFLSWQICRNIDWLAAAGIIADKGFLPAQEFLKKVKKKYSKINLNYLVDLLNAADAKEKTKEAVQILLKSKSPQDLINSEIARWEKEVNGEISRLVEEHKQKALFIAGGKVILYEVTPKFYLRGEIANKIQEIYPDKIVIIGEIKK